MPQVDALMAEAGNIDVENSGSTAVVGLLQGRRLITAWVGDSRGIIASRWVIHLPMLQRSLLLAGL
jgi:serine/threonine protein phosphatase PrpC